MDAMQNLHVMGVVVVATRVSVRYPKLRVLIARESRH